MPVTRNYPDEIAKLVAFHKANLITTEEAVDKLTQMLDDDYKPSCAVKSLMESICEIFISLSKEVKNGK